MRAVFLTFIVFFPAICAFAEVPNPDVTTIRVPAQGLSPQSQPDSAGRLHLIYFKGDPAHGNIFYTTSSDFAQTFAPPITVNSTPESALIIGTVRGPQLAVASNNIPHIAWMASPTEFSYTHLTPNHAFQPQRNLIQARPGLDAGGSITAAPDGTLYVAWHAPTRAKDPAEANRRIWISRSTDAGSTFSPETTGDSPALGVCACCNLRAFATNNRLYVLYRSAANHIHRDIHLLTFSKDLIFKNDLTLATLEINKCIMSTASFALATDGPLCAFESDRQVFLYNLSTRAMESPPPGPARTRKHPTLSVNKDNIILLTWTEDTSFNKGGSVAWQLFNPELKPLSKIAHAPNLPPNSIPTTFAKPDGSFVILY